MHGTRWWLALGLFLVACSSTEEEAWRHTENSKRDRDPETALIMEALDASPGMKIAEIGAGYGYFSFKLSRLVGPSGHVIAIDFDPTMVSRMAKEKDARRATNVRVVHAAIGLPPEVMRALPADHTLGETQFEAEDLDAILLVVVGFFTKRSWPESDSSREPLRQLWTWLKPGGKIVIHASQVRLERGGCAPEAPYRCADATMRELVERAAGLFEVEAQRAFDVRPGGDPSAHPFFLVLRKPLSRPKPTAVFPGPSAVVPSEAGRRGL
jgi:SAM-dependent methyltransferase